MCKFAFAKFHGFLYYVWYSQQCLSTGQAELTWPTDTVQFIAGNKVTDTLLIIDGVHCRHFTDTMLIFFIFLGSVYVSMP